MNIHPHLYTEQRPWGEFIRFTQNEPSTVKILNVKSGQSLSLQYHHHRDELWYVISGTGTAIIDDDSVLLSANQTYHIDRTIPHRINAESDLQILEISRGEFDEADIVRLSDDYGRSTTKST